MYWWNMCPSMALEKKIEPSQTPFPAKIVPLPNRTLALHQESKTDGSITDAFTNLDAPLRAIQQEQRNYHQRNNMQAQQTYVAMTPVVMPGAGNQLPVLTTWGTVDSMSLVLSRKEQDDTEAKSSSFSLPSENESESLARKAEAELTRRAKRAKTSKSKKVRGAGPLTSCPC
jgi:hypothetical protein